jgi:SAF domain-containing protein
VTALLERTPRSGSTTRERDGGVTGYRLPANPRRRRPVLAAASAVAVFGSVALFAHLYSTADRQTPVLVVTHTIQEGQELTAGDLGQTSVAAGPGISIIPASDAPQVLGKVVSVTVTTGSLLTPDDVSTVPAIGAGDAVVGLALKQGQLPAAGVSAGDQVMVVETGAPGSPLNAFAGASAGTGSSSSGSSTSGSGSPSAASSGDAGGGQGPSGVLVPVATVFNTATPAQSSGDTTELVSLELGSSVAPAVSSAAAAGQVSLVLVPSTTSSASYPSTGSLGRSKQTRPAAKSKSARGRHG